MIDSQIPAEEGPRTGELSKRAFFAVLAAMVALVIGATLLVVTIAGSGEGSATSAGVSVHRMTPPLNLSSVSEPVAGHYRYAKSHMAEFRQVPCWCGCQQFLGHHDLADCFVRADGKWEAHAAGCGVCIGEATIAERMLGEGRSAADVKATVDSQFGSTAITTPPPTT